jgi:hypothetical protein
MKSSLSGLYYPFSRCIQPTSLKQMLLVFDEITFVDPVDDAQWRAKLFSDLESYDPEFARYQSVDAALPTLIQQGCIKRFDPGPRINDRSLATESALGDLNDPNWLQAASTPHKFAMPSITMSGKHSWQVFKPKLPDQFVNALRTLPGIQRHLFVEGDDFSSWSLSYAAGSAIGISVHLDIAEELSLAPITDSPMHHRLLMMKMARALNVNNTVTAIADDVVRPLTVKMASTLLSQVLPEEHLQRATFEEISRFREQTASLRKHFVRDIEMRIGQLRSVPSAQEWVAGSRQVLSGLELEFRKYEAEFASGRMKIWPNVLKSTTSAVAAGSLAAVGLSLIPGPHALLVGGIAGLAIGAAVSGLDWAAERVKIQKSAAPSVAYLSSVSKRLG